MCRVFVIVLLTLTSFIAHAGMSTTHTLQQSNTYTTASFSSEGITFNVTPVKEILPNDRVVIPPGEITLSVVSSGTMPTLAKFRLYRAGEPPPGKWLPGVKKTDEGFEVTSYAMAGRLEYYWCEILDPRGARIITRTIVVKVKDEAQ